MAGNQIRNDPDGYACRSISTGRTGRIHYDPAWNSGIDANGQLSPVALKRQIAVT